MTLFRLFSSLRRYGIRGTVDWVVRICNRKQDPLIQTLRSHISDDIVQIKGITVIGDLTPDTSLNKVLVDLVRSLSEAKIPHQVFDVSKPIPNDFVSNRYTDIITMFRDIKLKELSPCRLHRIVFWEFDTGFSNAHPDCIDGSPLIAMSNYCFAAIRAQVHPETTVSYIRYPFHFTVTHPIERSVLLEKFNIPKDAFVVLFNFDYRSSYYRKNPEGLLSAFEEAFANVPQAVLVFKTNGSKQKPEMKAKLERIVANSTVSNRVYFIDTYVSNDELVSLTAACDVYASLHRGEGFGLGIAEAMSLGKAVVVSDCGSTNEFCHPDTAEIIPHEIVSVKPEQIDFLDYTWVQKWPEPDVHMAAVALRKLYDAPQNRTTLGIRAKAFIENYYSVDNFKKSIDSFFALSEDSIAN